MIAVVVGASGSCAGGPAGASAGGASCAEVNYSFLELLTAAARGPLDEEAIRLALGRA